MSEVREIVSDLHADAQVILFLHRGDYSGLLKFIDAQYGLRFMMERTGASFEDCIDWCAQNAGSVETARHVLRLLFDRYYPRLPKPVQDDLLYLAEEVGYDPKRTTLDELKALCRPEIRRGPAKMVSLTGLARQLLSNTRGKLIGRFAAAPTPSHGGLLKV
jgi:hypothetical protein